MRETTQSGGATRASAVEPLNNPVPVRPASKRGRLASIVSGIYGNDRRLQLALLAFMLLCYSALLGISLKLSPSRPMTLTFNSMLDHLLRGRFDVDPQIVGSEGFLRDGHVYAYWGIWCALLRLPLWIGRRMDIDMTMWSCLAAVCLAGMAKVRAVLMVRKCALDSPTAKGPISLMLAYILLGGSEVGNLRVLIYEEPIMWAAAFGSLFVYFAVKGMVNRRFDLATLSSMALCAGLALLTRASTGIGLMLAMVLLLVVLALESGSAKVASRGEALLRLGSTLTQRRILIPLGILAVFIAATGAVNFFRWGNATVFADFKLYLRRDSTWTRIMDTYGLFNFSRIPYGLVYYFFPVWVLHGADGHLLMEKTRAQLLVSSELPPSSFFLTDLLPLCFIAFLAITLWRRRSGTLPPLSQLAAVAAGLLAPCVLMLTAIFMAYRYRMDFYPEIDFLAFLGLYAAVGDETMLARFVRDRKWITAALVVSIVSSFGTLTVYDLLSASHGQTLLNLYHNYIRWR